MSRLAIKVLGAIAIAAIATAAWLTLSPPTVDYLRIQGEGVQGGAVVTRWSCWKYSFGLSAQAPETVALSTTLGRFHDSRQCHNTLTSVVMGGDAFFRSGDVGSAEITASGYVPTGISGWIKRIETKKKTVVVHAPGVVRACTYRTYDFGPLDRTCGKRCGLNPDGITWTNQQTFAGYTYVDVPYPVGPYGGADPAGVDASRCCPPGYQGYGGAVANLPNEFAVCCLRANCT